MTPSDLARWRLATLGPAASYPSAETALSDLVATQAQDFLPGCWSLAQRASATSRAAVEATYDDGALLRTHVLRPTWHFVNPADLRMLIVATAPRVHRINGSMYRREGIDDSTMAMLRKVLERELATQHLTRNQLAVHFSKAGITVKGLPLSLVMMYAELEGWVCSGRRDGAQHTYALVDERVPESPWPTREEALAHLAAAYLRTRGPATVRDLATWASLTLTEARTAVDDLGDQVTLLDIEGRDYLHLSPVEGPSQRETRVDLVQCYDELVMSYSESRDVLSGGTPLPGDRRDEPAFYNAVLRDGVLVGFWRYTRNNKGVPDHVETRLYGDIDQSLLDNEVARFLSWAAG